jgi:hypothetical protein
MPWPGFPLSTTLLGYTQRERHRWGTRPNPIRFTWDLFKNNFALFTEKTWAKMRI